MPDSRNLQTGYPPRELQLQLRLEGLAFAALALYFYAAIDASWWLFAALILVPDLSALGFIIGREFGARVYNLVHLWIWPVALSFAGYLIVTADPPGSALLLAIGLIWATHIGVDRALGYGLKRPDSIEITHLGPIGKMKKTIAEGVGREGDWNGAA